MIPRVLCPLLTPAGSAVPFDTACQLYLAYPAVSPGKSVNLRPVPAPYTPPSFGSLGFRCVSPAHPDDLASYGVLVHRAVVLPPASFGFHLAMDTLAFG